MNETTLTTVTEQRELTPDVWRMIGAIVETTCVTSGQKADKAQKLLFAYENGLPLNLAFNGGLYIVNGRMAVEGVIIRAKVNQSDRYHQKIEHANNEGCTSSFWQKASSDWPYHLYDSKAEPGDWVKLGEISFTEEDAKRADLLRKDAYKKYGEDMYINRVTVRGHRRYMSDLFNGPIYIHGEIEGTDFQPDPNAVEGEIIPDYNSAMQALLQEYGPDAILAANGQRMPSTLEDLEALRARLENDNGQ